MSRPERRRVEIESEPGTISHDSSDIEEKGQRSELGYKWKAQFVTKLLREIPRITGREPSPKDLKDVPKWCGDLSEISPTAYLRDLTNYLACIKINPMTQLMLLHKAMTGPALGWLQLNHPKV